MHPHRAEDGTIVEDPAGPGRPLDIALLHPGGPGGTYIWLTVPLLLAGASVVTDQDLLTFDEMRRDPMYNELFRPNGFQWFAAVGFTSSYGRTSLRKTCS